MRIYTFILLIILTGCTHRTLPTEVAIIREEKKIPVLIPQKNETIIVDAGHGGKDAGASGKKESYEEKELTLSTARMICHYLNKMGYKTVLTRNQDIFVPLETRAEIANTLKADLFVSIHYNYSPSEDAKGVEVFYYKETKTPLPSRIVHSKELGHQVLSGIVQQTGAHGRGVKPANFAVIRETKMPAILIEGGFLSNPQEREKLRDPRYLQFLARGIARGVDHYCNGHEKS